MQLEIQTPDETIDLFGSGYASQDYFPSDAEENGVCTDRLIVTITGSSASDLSNKIQALERAFAYAATHQDRREWCWLNFSIVDTGDTWRSRIIAGAVMLSPRISLETRTNVAVATVAISRLPYWEGPETEIPLRNSNGNEITGGINVYNCNDLSGSAPNKNNNWVRFLKTSITGSLPSPLKITVKRLFAAPGERETAYIWAFLNQYPADLGDISINNPFFLDSETATGGTPVSNVNSSDGYYRACTIGDGAVTELLVWQMDGSVIESFAHKFFNVICRFGSAYNLGDARFRIKIGASPHFYYGPWVTPGDISASTGRWVQLLGAVKMMSALVDPDSPPTYVRVALEGEGLSSGAKVVHVDYLQLCPTDGAAQFACQSAASGAFAALGDQQEMIYDPAAGLHYWRDGVIQTTDGWTLVGDQLQVIPGETGYIYWGFANTIGAADPLTSAHDKYNIRLHYRPRRKTL